MADSLGRSNKWAFVIYPESAPGNFIEILLSYHIQGCISPLHDADLNGDGSEKKPHYHVYLYFGSGAKQSESQVYEHFSKPLNGTHCIAISSEYGYIRYFIHLDNPDKAQYPVESIICFSGFDISSFFKPSPSMANDIMNEIKEWIIDNEITEFLYVQIQASKIPDWAYVLNMYNCFSIYKLLDSQRNYFKNFGDSLDRCDSSDWHD